MVYAWAVPYIPEDRWDEWHSELNDLLPWQSSDSNSAVELESDSFFEMQSKGGG